MNSTVDSQLSGLLTLKRRNLHYIKRYNTPEHIDIADDKIRTKVIAQKYGLPSTTLLQTIKNKTDIDHFLQSNIPKGSFVVKPAQGSSGYGVIVIEKADKAQNNFLLSTGKKISSKQLRHEMVKIHEGAYSLHKARDIIIVEKKAPLLSELKNFSYRGVPDLRFIVFKGFPIISMLRLSTRVSKGKSNLHQGAIGIGIHLSTGHATHAIQNKESISAHPNTGLDFKEIKIPYWNDCLKFASHCYDIFKIGYMGVDLILNESHPELLELNARPGLSIQYANKIGIAPRLRHIESIHKTSMNSVERIEYVKKNMVNL